MRDPYFDREPPKSLDRNHFAAAAGMVEALGDADGAATLSAFTVEATAAALRRVPEPPSRWLVGGGGRRNPFLMRRLAERLGVAVEPVEAIGFDGDAIEAQCFAYLALRSRRGAPLSFPTTTGAPAPMTGGASGRRAKKEGPRFREALSDPPDRRDYWQTLTFWLPRYTPFMLYTGRICQQPPPPQPSPVGRGAIAPAARPATTAGPHQPPYQPPPRQ